MPRISLIRKVWKFLQQEIGKWAAHASTNEEMDNNDDIFDKCSPDSVANEQSLINSNNSFDSFLDDFISATPERVYSRKHSIERKPCRISNSCASFEKYFQLKDNECGTPPWMSDEEFTPASPVLIAWMFAAF